ncbi:hypothetical protein C4K20_2905 [Pseudomonas chlororaphis subsp. aurantiaca]|nr:hypothetical protein C4K20_2905 [Pseudomonas chlororaphis subsp. aurantiaca]
MRRPSTGAFFIALDISDMTMGYQLSDVKMTIAPSKQSSLLAVLT